jgi:MoaA/NifB/PqqE/SkfB family radical SAM enzyme
MSFHPRARRALEELNFVEVAVSMDAVHADLHREIRGGLQSAKYIENFSYLLDLRRRKGVRVMLNVTEHRLNWFELPEIFRFAERHQVALHINTCIHPHNVTLYTLPTGQLRYVLDFLEEEWQRLEADHFGVSNRQAYEHLLALVRGELRQRGPLWLPMIAVRNTQCSGFLAAPRPGQGAFRDPGRVEREAERLVRYVEGDVAARMIDEMITRIKKHCEPALWHWTARHLEKIRATLPSYDPAIAFQ